MREAPPPPWRGASGEDPARRVLWAHRLADPLAAAHRDFYARLLLDAPGEAALVGPVAEEVAADLLRAGKRPLVVVHSEEERLALSEGCGVGVREVVAAEGSAFTLPRPVALIAAPFGALSRHVGEAAWADFLGHARRNLLPGGRLLFDLPGSAAPGHPLPGGWCGSWATSPPRGRATSPSPSRAARATTGRASTTNWASRRSTARASPGAIATPASPSPPPARGKSSGGGAGEAGAAALRCREILPPAWRPDRIVAEVGLLPRTPHGKLDRAALKRRAEAILRGGAEEGGGKGKG